MTTIYQTKEELTQAIEYVERDIRIAQAAVKYGRSNKKSIIVGSILFNPIGLVAVPFISKATKNLDESISNLKIQLKMLKDDLAELESEEAKAQ